MHMKSTHFRNSLQMVPFDSDSQPIMFDDGASASITNDLWDFVTRPTAISCKVKGIAGSAKATYHGTVKWKIEDDNNIIHTFVIPNTYYITAAPTSILSPQHFAQQMQYHSPHAEGTGCMTTSMAIVLFWDQRKFTKTVKLDPKLNIAMMNTAPGIKHYKDYLMNQEGMSNQNASVFETQIIPEDESDNDQDNDDLSFQPPDPIQASNSQETCHPAKTITEDTQQTQDDATPTEVISLELPHTIPDDREPTTIDAQDELI